jgi:hypothetical protein
MLITKAPPAAPLTIGPGMGEMVFRTANTVNAEICMATIAGSSNLDLKVFNVTATGTITPGQAGELEIVLLAAPNDPLKGTDPTHIYPQWTAIAHTPKEPVGGATDLDSTMWMVQGINLMYYLASGKMQGTWVCNIADHPTTAIDMSNALLGLMPDVDPIMMFAVSAIFTPTADPITEPYPVATLDNLIISGDA